MKPKLRRSPLTHHKNKTTSSSKYKVVFLDWYGTLSTSKFWSHLNGEFTSQIETSLFGNIKPMIDPWMRGEHKAEDVVKELSKDTGLPYQMLFEELVKSCQSMKFISANTMSLVKGIRHKGTKVVIATDNMDSFTRWTAPAMKLNDLFDGTLNSHDLKALKKDFDDKNNSLFFSKFLADFKVKPEECVLIDDSEDKEGRIQKSGIVYKKIDSGGLINELQLLFA